MRAIALPIGRPDSIKAWRLLTFGFAWLALAWAILDIRMMLIANVPLASDSGDYWIEWHGPMYDPIASLHYAHFNYSPVAALAFWPLAQLPQMAFAVFWAALGTAAYVWMVAPLPLPSRLPAIAAGFLFCVNGNMEWALAMVAVFGLRRPGLWLIALFTKILPFVCFGWFVIRGEWRSVASTAAIGVALVAVSALILPGAWPTWLQTLPTLGTEAATTPDYNSIMPPIPLVLRIAAAAALVVWGARRNQPIVMPFALILLQPDWQPWALGLLAAVPRLVTAPQPRAEPIAASLPQFGNEAGGSGA